MRSRFPVVFLTILLTLSSALARAETRPSRPQKAVIYRDGYAVLEEKVTAAGSSLSIRLPAGTDLTSVQMFQQGKRVHDLQFEQLMEEETSSVPRRRRKFS